MRDPRSLHARSLPRWGPAVALAAGVLAGCQPVGGMPGVDPAFAGLGCEQSETFLFRGETTLAAIGLGDHFGGPDASRGGMVWVTAEPVSMWGPGPQPAGAPDAQRMVCVLWPDGSGMSGPLPEGWELPSALAPAAAQEGDGPPIVLIGLVVAAALIGGVSFLAFRGDPH